MTSSAVVAPRTEPLDPGRPLADLPERCVAIVIAVDGDDLVAQRLAACGFWPGAEVECIGKAPFGDPLLFRVHGYRLALRCSEAARVQVREVPGVTRCP